MRDGYVANKVEHPGAVAILDDDVMDDGTPFLVMDLLEGKTLRRRLVDGPLELEDALDAVAAVLDVVAAAHDKGARDGGLHASGAGARPVRRYPSARAMKCALDAARADLRKRDLLAAVAPVLP
jgi:hypothetical protein